MNEKNKCQTFFVFGFEIEIVTKILRFFLNENKTKTNIQKCHMTAMVSYTANCVKWGGDHERIFVKLMRSLKRKLKC